MDFLLLRNLKNNVLIFYQADIAKNLCLSHLESG